METTEVGQVPKEDRFNGYKVVEEWRNLSHKEATQVIDVILRFLANERGIEILDDWLTEHGVPPSEQLGLPKGALAPARLRALVKRTQSIGWVDLPKAPPSLVHPDPLLSDVVAVPRPVDLDPGTVQPRPERPVLTPLVGRDLHRVLAALDAHTRGMGWVGLTAEERLGCALGGVLALLEQGAKERNEYGRDLAQIAQALGFGHMPFGGADSLRARAAQVYNLALPFLAARKWVGRALDRVREAAAP